MFHRANGNNKHGSRAIIGPSVLLGEVDFLYFKQLLDADPALILEIDANDGTHTGLFLTDFPSAKICVFEPDPRASAKFKLRTQWYCVHLFEFAIGAKDGKAEIHVSSDLPKAWRCMIG